LRLSLPSPKRSIGFAQAGVFAVKKQYGCFMAQEIEGIKVPFLPIGGVDGLRTTPPISQPGGKSFDEVLRGELDRLKFSHHAKTRLESRNIQLSESDVKSLADAVDQASQKGSQDSLLIMKNVAYIVNVKNRTVVTAVVTNPVSGNGGNLSATGGSHSGDENVFTNIDSAVLVKTQGIASQQ